MDLTEAEDIKKRWWQEYMEELYKKDLVAAAAAKSLQSCPTLFDPIDGSPPGSPVPGILQAHSYLLLIAFSFPFCIFQDICPVITPHLSAQLQV